MIERQICPQCGDADSVVSELRDDGTVVYMCMRSRPHLEPGAYSWLVVPRPEGVAPARINAVAQELRLDVELPLILSRWPGTWLEYGVVEAVYAETHPRDFRWLVNEYGHTAKAPSKYTASSFLAGTLGTLHRAGKIGYHDGGATGRWSYLNSVSWWTALPPEPWDKGRHSSWESLGLDTADYVPAAQRP